MNITIIPRSIRRVSCESKISPKFTQVLFCAAAVCIVIGTSACSTTRGFGRDVQTAGKKIEKSAN